MHRRREQLVLLKRLLTLAGAELGRAPAQQIRTEFAEFLLGRNIHAVHHEQR